MNGAQLPFVVRMCASEVGAMFADNWA